ncbi:MAG: hypothetical protein KIT84_39355 [Labilithrix sp.]|nr:hypothetical protein [Labilithrix sp.]MCW5817120.1 hypothetical protein [Labilithrix sp.]
MRWLKLGIVSVVGVVVGCGGASASAPETSAAPATSATAAAGSGFGVIVMAHGGSPEWNQGVIDSVEPLRAKYPIEIAFGMADATTMKDAAQKIEARGAKRVAVVRLFVSGESWFERTEQIFGTKPGAPADGGASDPHAAHHGGGHGGHSMAFFRVPSVASYAFTTEGLSDVPEMGVVLADRAAALSKEPAKEDVLILAHGPEDDGENERWLTKLGSRADTIKKRAPFRRVQVETLREDWPDKRAPAEQRIRAYVERAKNEGGKAIVIPFRVQGFGPYKEVLKDLDYVADGKGLIPHPEVTKWIDRQIVALQAGPFRPQVQ